MSVEYSHYERSTPRRHAQIRRTTRGLSRSVIQFSQKGPTDVLDHATSEIATGTKPGIDATRKLAGEGFKRPWPPLIKMSEEVRRKIDALFKTNP
jgi:4-hydroxy-3-polyprenylbenzoate decarboxylase